MFTNYSMAGVGLLTYVLSFVLAYLGINADSGQIAGWVNSILEVGGLVLLIVGQLRRSDLSMGLFRK